MRKILLLLFAVLLTAVSAYSFTSGGIYYNITSSTDKTVEVTYTIGYNTYSGSVSIPQTVSNNGTTYRVTAIGAMAFRECTNLTGVTIPSSVTSIDEYAFYKCTSLPRVTIPNSVTVIGINAFLSCNNLTSVDISNSLTSIPANAFACTSLTSVTIPNSVTTIEQGAFNQCYSLTSVVIGSGVTSIGYNVFGNNTTITYIECKGNTPPTIDSSTFTSSHYSNATLKVPRNFESTYRSAEYWSNFTDIVSYDIEKNGIYYLITSEENKTVEVTYKNKDYNSYSGSITIPSTVQHNNKTYRVTTIDNYAFYGCSGLTSVTIPSSVTTIELWAFRDCSSLTSVVIPNSVTTIGQVAFYNCPQLSSVVIGSGVTSIGIAAFNYCTALTSITCWAETPPSIDSSTFGGNQYSNAQLYVPVGKKSAYQAANGWANFNNIQELAADFVVNGIYYRITSTSPREVEVTYGNGDGNSYSGSVTIPSTVTYGGSTYRVTRIGDEAFYNCAGLTSVTIPSSVTTIGINAFSLCTGLTSLTIPSSVTYLGSFAFSLCTGLTSVTVPASVTDMGAAPFAGCDGLTTLKVASGNPVYSSPNNCNAIIRTSDHALINGCKTTVIPNNVTAIETDAFLELPSLTGIAIPSSVTTIGRGAFASCTGLTSMTLPPSVITIGEFAFQGCTSMTSVTLPSSLTAIGGFAFQWCNLMSVTCQAQTPPDLADVNAFDPDTYTNATLSVPVGKKSAYQAANGWANFNNIQELAADFVVNGIYYIITGTSPATVKVTYRDSEHNSYSGNVTIPSTVTHGGTTYTVNEVGRWSFYDCAGLTSVTIPSSVTYIDDYAFENCTGLTSITIPSSVTAIGHEVFASCTGLTSLTIPSSVTYLGEAAFGLCTGLTSVTVPASVTDMGAAPFTGCDGLTTLKVASGNPVYSSPNNCNAIIRTSDHALINGCNTTVIPNNVTAIETGAFFALPSLTSIAIPSSVTYIGRSAFASCTGLTSMTLPSSVTTIEVYAFGNCSGLTSMTLPPSVITIGEAAFQGCTSLTSVTLPSSLTAIGGNAFQWCNLMNVTCLAQTPPVLANNAVFDWDTYNNASLYVPSASVSAYQAAFGWSNFAHVTVYIEPEAYACYTPSNTTLTFYYDNQRSSRTGTTYDLNTGDSSPGWYLDQTYKNVTTAVFDPSFAGARPTSTSRWFGYMDNLTSITGISNLNTSEVTNMKMMFYHCSNLASLDVSGFNTANVADMYGMFYYCGALTSLDVSGFNTANVTKMAYMFRGCSGLTIIDVSGFNTAKVTSMSDMFYGCSGVTSLDLSGFNTESVTGMGNMFDGCSGLTTLDLSSFNTTNVTSMRYMFDGCSNLTTIYVTPDTWSNVAVLNSEYLSSGTFSGCTSLVGGAGTTYDANHVNADYAHIDGGPSNPGYLTAAGAEPWHEPEAYACYTPSNTTLTFYYDNQRSSRTGTTYDLNRSNNYPRWYSDSTCRSVTKVVFNPSFADARPTSTFRWFNGMTHLTSITGISFLNTENVTNMAYMFYNCSGLTSLDVSNFNTAKVTEMGALFYGCSGLTNLDVSGFNTDRVIGMSGTFAGCSGLTSLDLSNFNTAKVTIMSNMFYNCSGLTSLDLSNFNTAKVTNMGYMFKSSRNLRTIYVGSEWNTDIVTSSTNMFLDCTSLVGGQGTTYDPDHVNKTYAHIDGGSSNPGYFTAAGAEPWHEPEAYACYTPSNTTLTFYYDNQRSTREGTTYDLNEGMANPGWDDDNSYESVTHVVFDPSFADARPTSTCSWFWGMTNLQTITGMDCMNTEDVTTMWGMFTSCSSLTTLDLSSFNTSWVTNMLSMFSDCSNLTTIYAGSGWSMATVSVTTNMFTNCTKLVGGKGTTYDPNHTNGFYARIDGGTSNPGYFSEKSLIQRGDVDGDGRIDINDVTMLNYVVLGQSQGTYYPEAADCDVENGDGSIDINDVTALIGRVLTGSW